MRYPNRRLAGRLRRLTLLATLFAGTVLAQDTAIIQDALIAPDATITRDARQDMVPIGWEGKLRFHAKSAYGPGALARAAVSSAYLLGIDSPPEWGQDGLGYGQRLGSTLAHSGVRNLIGFSLDSALHQDPRYYRSTERGVWRRTKHAFRETILTHKDSGGETLSTWRLGSAYGAAFISNEWRPDRGNIVAQGLSKGSTQLGIDLLSNVGREFWPDIKGKLQRRRP